MKRKRQSVPREVVESVLVRSRRRCALCYFLYADVQVKAGHIAHVVPMNEGGTHAVDNLVFLCPTHHAQLDMKSGPVAISPEELRAAREMLYQAIEQWMTPQFTSAPRVFVVHGRDDAAKAEVVSFLKETGLEPVVLSEQPSMGRTALEKLESYGADVRYALVVLSPDEPPSEASDGTKKASRPRQNVILELGYFMGRLGRNRVCALHRPNVELPSDFHGILYVEMDRRGNWRRTVGRELCEAGVVSSKS